MNQNQQENIFIQEVQRTLSRMAAEFELSAFFVVGALEIILLDIKQDLMDALNNGDEGEEEM
jgi:hypothetical protein